MSGLRNDPLFVGLTRPTLIFGVSLHYAMLNMMICGMYFIQTSSISIVLVGVVIHLIGYILCFKEPRFMELYLVKLGKFNQCPNKSYYGANSYDV
jgi:type IV secretion system protein VirB3